MFLSAKAYFSGNIDTRIVLYRQAKTALPEEFVRRYKRNVVAITPKKTGALRRSIITQALGGTAMISWRSAYAKAQDDGGHDVPRNVKGRNTRDGGFGIIPAGFHRYRQYTTPGTGPNFATTAFKATSAEMQAVYRELGLTK